MLSITTPHRKSAGSKTGSNSPFTKRFHASEAAAANSGASPILPARRRKPQKPTLSAKPSAMLERNEQPGLFDEIELKKIG